MTTEYQQYSSYISRALFDRGVIDVSAVDADDEIYSEWTGGSTESLGNFLYHAAAEGWIDRSLIGTESDDTDEVFEALVQYVLDEPCEDYSFGNIICKYICESGAASGELICMILFDQEIFDPSESERDSIESGRRGAAFEYVKRQIKNGELTPATFTFIRSADRSQSQTPKTDRFLPLSVIPAMTATAFRRAGTST